MKVLEKFKGAALGILLIFLYKFMLSILNIEPHINFHYGVIALILIVVSIWYLIQSTYED